MPMLSALKPGSFGRLVFVGMSLVCLPLVVAILYVGHSVGRLEQETRTALHVASAAGRGGRALVDQVRDFERKARQHAVLRDQQSFQALTERAESVRRTLAELSALGLPGEQREWVRALEDDLSSLSKAYRDGEAIDASSNVASRRFDRLNALAAAILSANSRWASDEAEALERNAGRVKEILAWLGAALIPLTAGLALFFSVLISRPVRQIHDAIRRLGSGDLSTLVFVKGPRDLELVGARLDWLRQRLADAQAEKRQFLAHASHDLKTPLTAIREGAELLLDKVVGGLTPEQAEVAGILRQNSLRLQRTIQTLLDVSVAEGREGPLRSEGLSLVALVESVLSDHKPALLKKEISLVSDLKPAAVDGDPEQLRTLVDNLVSNAVKFTPVGGEIFVSVKRLSDAAVIEVRDSGPGIADEESRRIFEPFYQGKSRADGLIKGSGLGLSIAKGCAEAHGGKIELIHNDKGACFRVLLPRSARGHSV